MPAIDRVSRLRCCFLVALVCLSQFIGRSHAQDYGDVIDQEYLSIDLEYQRTQVWCWVAAAKMVADYYEKDTPSQCEMLESEYGQPCCDDEAACTRPGHIVEVSRLIRSFGLRSSRIDGPIDGWRLLRLFKRGRPVVLYVDNSHFVVASGIKVVATRWGPLGIVHILDPLRGEYDEPLPSLYRRWGAAVYVR